MLWVKTSVKLPPYGKFILVSDGKEVAMCVRSSTDIKGDHFMLVDGQEEEFTDVVEWMELPEPSK